MVAGATLGKRLNGGRYGVESAPQLDRRAAMADAAIAIIGGRGLRALTHRAVDEALALPDGSTSYYLRTRRALLERVVGRLAERTAADLRAVQDSAHISAQVSGRDAAGADRTVGAGRLAAELELPDRLDALSGRAGALLDRMIGVRRVDSLARYALTVELATDPGLHRSLIAGQPLREMAAGALSALGAPDAATQALDLVSMTDGLVFDRLVGTRSLLGPDPGTPESVAELTRAVRTFLRGVFGC